MRTLVFMMFISILSAQAYSEDGKILKVLGGSTAYLVRGGSKQILTSDTAIEVGDELFSEDAVILLHLFPSTQLTLAKNSRIKLDKSFIDENDLKEKSSSVISFVQGLIRIKVDKEKEEEIEQTVQADGVSFGVRGTDYEISLQGEDFDLDVHEGAVEVSSPHVMTFVPEIVKKGKGFRFNKKERKFITRKFRPKFKDHPGFLKRTELRERWAKNKEERKARRLEKKLKKEKNLKSLQERKELRRSQRRDKKKRS